MILEQTVADYEEMIKKGLADATKYAESGDASMMECVLSTAELYAKRSEQDISEKVDAVRSLCKK